MLTKQLDDCDVRASTNWVGETWDEYEKGDVDVKCDCTLQVIALRNFACAPTEEEPHPPYTQLFKACEAVSETQLSALLDTNLMRATTNFKWDTYVKSRVLKRLYKYMVHFILAGITMVLSTHTSAANAEFHENGGWGGEWGRGRGWGMRWEWGGGNGCWRRVVG